MKNYRLEMVLFIVCAIYMILELIASRMLSPYFGNTNIVWTSIIGIILFSNSIGNFIGGKIADKNCSKVVLKGILKMAGIILLVIPFIQESLISTIALNIISIKIGAVLSSILLFFIPSMLFGFFSPIIIKLKMHDLKNAGSVSGKIYAIATLGSLFGTFLGGFFLLNLFGSNELLFVLAVVLFLLVFLIGELDLKKDIIFSCIGVILCIISIILFNVYNTTQDVLLKKGVPDAKVTYDTQYGKVSVYNKGSVYRVLAVGDAVESVSFIDQNKYTELIAYYTKAYDLMFESSLDVENTLMIGGGGFSYPKYYISNYTNKTMDVVEIDGDLIEIAKEYFYLDKLIEEYDLEDSNRLNIIVEDGRTYLNKNTKKYDAILNDAFKGKTPVVNLTTIEAVQKIYDSLTFNGVYLSNIVASIDGKNSKFLKAEVNTLKQVFKNVYVIPCENEFDFEYVQNLMVVATDEYIDFENDIDLKVDKNAIILTDNYAPVDNLVADF